MITVNMVVLDANVDRSLKRIVFVVSGTGVGMTLISATEDYSSAYLRLSTAEKASNPSPS